MERPTHKGTRRERSENWGEEEQQGDTGAEWGQRGTRRGRGRHGVRTAMAQMADDEERHHGQLWRGEEGDVEGTKGDTEGTWGHRGDVGAQGGHGGGYRGDVGDTEGTWGHRGRGGHRMDMGDTEGMWGDTQRGHGGDTDGTWGGRQRGCGGHRGDMRGTEGTWGGQRECGGGHRGDPGVGTVVAQMGDDDGRSTEQPWRSTE